MPTGSGSLGPVSPNTVFTNPRLFKVIVLVCQKSNSQLYASSVQFDSEGAPASPNSLAHGVTLPGSVTEANLCSLGGATHDDVSYGDHQAPHITIPQ